MLLGTAIQAQGTYQDVVSLFNTSCTFSSCHNADFAAAGLDFSGSEEDIYSQLINVDPFNEAAAEKGYKLVKPGDPGKSFLYRKVNHGLHNDSQLTAEMNDPMPAIAMDNQDIELIRQWILFGAKNDDKTYIDKAILEDYYVNENGLDPLEAPPAPAPGEGFQLHFGPIFLAPGEEIEYIYRYELENQEPLEINEIDVTMNQQSHHFLFFKFEEGAEENQPDGLIEVDFLGTITGNASAITSDTKMIGGWAYSTDFKLPQGTAFKWDEEEVLKFNYHIVNYSNSSVMPAELYVNIYTQEPGEALHEMHSEFHIQFPDNPLDFIPPGETTHTWDFSGFDEANSQDSVHIWSLGAHTHKLGTDFDIYLEEGGEQIYEGFYNFDYTVNQGSYDYSEPPFRKFDPLQSIKKSDGIFVTADYNNPTNESVSVGLTTEDEMFGFFVQYLVGDISDLDSLDVVGISELNQPKKEWSVFPNPSTGQLNLQLDRVEDVQQIKVFNILGELLHIEKVSGNIQSHQLDLSDFENGVYFIQIQGQTEGKYFYDTRKLTLQK